MTPEGGGRDLGRVDSESRFARYVGRTSAPVTLEVELGNIRRFAGAVGDPNPIYRDQAAARAAGYERIPAPPTFATTLRGNDPRDGIELDWKRLLHGEQEYLFERPILAGDRLTLVGRIAAADVKEGRSGVMDVMVVETVASDDRGATVFRARAHILVRRPEGQP